MKSLKHILLAVSVFMLVFSMVGCSSKKEDEQVTGGWKTVEDGTITEDLQELFDKAMEGYTGVNYKPIKLLETQVVSGKNYKFLCEATVVYPGAQPKQVIVTIYEDTKGNAEVTDIEDVESESTQIANPYVTVETMEEAEAGAGFDFTVPETVDGFEGRSISYIENDMIQVIYGDDDHSLYVRKAKGNEDISGDYNEYASVEEMTIGELNVTVKVNDDGIHTVIWNNGDYTYALITVNTALDQAAVEALVASIQ